MMNIIGSWWKADKKIIIHTAFLCEEYIWDSPKAGRKERVPKVVFSSMTTTFFTSWYEEVRKKLMGSFDSRMMLDERENGNR